MTFATNLSLASGKVIHYRVNVEISLIDIEGTGSPRNMYPLYCKMGTKISTSFSMLTSTV